MDLAEKEFDNLNRLVLTIRRKSLVNSLILDPVVIASILTFNYDGEFTFGAQSIDIGCNVVYAMNTRCQKSSWIYCFKYLF